MTAVSDSERGIQRSHLDYRLMFAHAASLDKFQSGAVLQARCSWPLT